MTLWGPAEKIKIELSLARELNPEGRRVSISIMLATVLQTSSKTPPKTHLVVMFEHLCADLGLILEPF